MALVENHYISENGVYMKLNLYSHCRLLNLMLHIHVALCLIISVGETNFEVYKSLLNLFIAECNRLSISL